MIEPESLRLREQLSFALSLMRSFASVGLWLVSCVYVTVCASALSSYMHATASRVHMQAAQALSIYSSGVLCIDLHVVIAQVAAPCSAIA